MRPDMPGAANNGRWTRYRYRSAPGKLPPPQIPKPNIVMPVTFNAKAYWHSNGYAACVQEDVMTFAATRQHRMFSPLTIVAGGATALAIGL
jgi:hypothetical protein